jgi:predicted heme/steroid binding protein
MTSESTVRRRLQANQASPTDEKTISTVPDQVEDQSSRVISILDILRVTITLIGVSFALSYYMTSGASLLWNYQPWFTDPSQVAHWWQGPLHLTPDQLQLFNGTDPKKPIYLAINGTIFDVSKGRHTYGPGGSYEVFAGRDATRAFVTGCFLEDRTGDLRGVEEIYIPVEDPDEEISSSEKKLRAERERREAKKRVLKEVNKWQNFYQNHKKYFEVGRLVGVPEYTEEPPKLCEPAQKGRPKRKNQKRAEAPGKPVQ